MERFTEKLLVLSEKFAQNFVLRVIQQAFMLLMPITMVGGFSALFNGISIEAYQNFIVSTGIKGVLDISYQWTTGMIGLYLSFLVAYSYAKNKGTFKSDIAIGLTSMLCFLMLTPYVPAESVSHLRLCRRTGLDQAACSPR